MSIELPLIRRPFIRIDRLYEFNLLGPIHTYLYTAVQKQTAYENRPLIRIRFGRPELIVISGIRCISHGCTSIIPHIFYLQLTVWVWRRFVILTRTSHLHDLSHTSLTSPDSTQLSKRVPGAYTRRGNCSPGSSWLYRLGVSQAQKTKAMSARGYALHIVCPKFSFFHLPMVALSVTDTGYILYA